MNWPSWGKGVSEGDIYYINFKHLEIYIFPHFNLASKEIHY